MQQELILLCFVICPTLVQRVSVNQKEEREREREREREGVSVVYPTNNSDERRNGQNLLTTMFD